MKCLLLLLVCLASLVQADTIATSEMMKGYRLFLFNTKEYCPAGLDALLAGNDSRPLRGCWLYEEGKVYVNYADGDFRIYPIEGFKVRESKPESNNTAL